MLTCRRMKGILLRMENCDKFCKGKEEKEMALCRAVGHLLPLYSGVEEDAPDSVLGDYPNPPVIQNALRVLIDVVFPGKMSHGAIDRDELGVYLMQRLSEAWRLLKPEIKKALHFRWIGAAAKMQADSTPYTQTEASEEATRIMRELLDRIPTIRRMLLEDVRAAYEGDPAALTYAEVQLAYPGILAIASHRLAHELYLLSVPILPRVMSEWIHSKTGIDIHPGATIGHGFFIDHATGVVIGETTHIGNRVKVYQGVTLGARSFSLDADGQPVKHVKRHPTVEDNVVIYANATILGGHTVIGAGSTIGGNVFLMESVPPDSFVVNEHPELKIKSVK